MKIATLLFGTLFISSAFVAKAQEETEQERECKRMRFLAGEELKIKNYATASSYYVKGETICGGYDKANYDRMTGTLRNAISTETDKAKKTAYTDTLVGAYERMETAGVYDQANDLIRATYIIQSSKPNRAKADELYARAIHKEGTAVTEAHVSYYYYNMYVMFTEATPEKKPELKKRLISEYFFLSKMITAANMSLKTQENLLSYFNGVVKTCDDILPELKGFMGSLPAEKEAKKASVNNFITLLEMKSCTKSKEYGMLIDTLNRIDPSVDGKIAQAKYLRSLDKFSDAIGALKDAKSMTSDEEKKEEIEYTILDIQFRDQNSYRAAYSTAMGISGKYRSSALKMAAQCVAQTANSCGSSTFERKANYLYAAQLADRAGDGSAAAKYRASGPADGDWFEAGVSSVTLSCWALQYRNKLKLIKHISILYKIPVSLVLTGILFSCVNDLESIKKVTYDPKAPDEVTKNLSVFYTDSGYAKIEVSAALAETYRKPDYVTKLKDGLKVNFFSADGKIVSTLSALYGEANFTKGMIFVKDSVRLYNLEKDQRMETEVLYWNQKDSSVYTNSNVIVRSPKGVLYGKGIQTKQDFSYYEFLKPYGKINFDD